MSRYFNGNEVAFCARISLSEKVSFDCQLCLIGPNLMSIWPRNVQRVEFRVRSANRSTCPTRGWNFRKRARNWNSWRRQLRPRKQSPARRESLSAEWKNSLFEISSYSLIFSHSLASRLCKVARLRRKLPKPKIRVILSQTRSDRLFLWTEKMKNTHSKKASKRTKNARYATEQSCATFAAKISSSFLLAAWFKMKYKKDAFRQKRIMIWQTTRTEYFRIDFSLSQESLTRLTFERNINKKKVNK